MPRHIFSGRILKLFIFVRDGLFLFHNISPSCVTIAFRCVLPMSYLRPTFILTAFLFSSTLLPHALQEFYSLSALREMVALTSELYVMGSNPGRRTLKLRKRT